MSNYCFIDRNVDISNITKQLELNHNDWYAVSRFDNISGDKEPKGFLPLVMASVPPGANPKNVESLQETPLYSKYTEIHKWLLSWGIGQTARMAFIRLKPGEYNAKHIDEGTYYLTKDRYHLAIQGQYRYQVGEEVHIIEPGTFFWFNNKLPHSSVNIGKQDRIALVFDVPHSPNNPHWKRMSSTI
jgi:quercetin dioxygenase-like cupin family protein